MVDATPTADYINYPIKQIIIHYAFTPDNKHFDMWDINEWHKARKFKPYVTPDGNRIYCGYHYVITREGVVQQCRPDDVRGVHTKGKNRNSLAICWVGMHEMTNEQRWELLNLVTDLMLAYELTPDDVSPHNHFSDTSCPGFDRASTYPSFEKFRDVLEKFKPIREGELYDRVDRGTH